MAAEAEGVAAQAWPRDTTWASGSDDRWQGQESTWEANGSKETAWEANGHKEPAEDRWAEEQPAAAAQGAAQGDRWAPERPAAAEGASAGDRWASEQRPSAAEVPAAEAAAAAAPQDRWGAPQPTAQAAAEPAPAARDPWATAAGDAAYVSQPTPAAPAAGSAWSSYQQSATPADGEEQPRKSTDFWNTQSYNKQRGILPVKEDWELTRDDELVFDQTGRAQAGINFAKYDQIPVDISGSKAQSIPVCQTFEELFEKFEEFVPPVLRDNLRRCKYETPTPVQKFAIPVGLIGRDVMCCAQTGSGKTAAFMIPVLGQMITHHKSPVGAMTVPYEGPVKPDALVLTPTRELCVQIFEEALKFLHRTAYRAARVYGGEPAKQQMVELAKGADLLVATPWRLQDFICRGIILMSSVNVLVLDEADRMLDMGFEAQIREVVEKHGMKPKDQRQTMMFSATFPESCQKLAMDFLFDHIWIAIGVLGSAVETVEQVLEKVEKMKKFDRLIEYLDSWFLSKLPEDRLLVFANSKDTARWLDEQLFEKYKMDTGALHGNLTQQQREKNLLRFRKGEIEIMIATDVAARGLDIPGVTIVLNYDIPKEIDTYVQRIGRTGRIGNEGKAITFVSYDERGNCIEQDYILKDLRNVMQMSRAQVPEWFDSLVNGTDATGNANWKWHNKDARAGQEEHKAWSNWGAAAGAASAPASASAEPVPPAAAAEAPAAASGVAGSTLPAAASASQDGWREREPDKPAGDPWQKEDPWQSGGAADSRW